MAQKSALGLDALTGVLRSIVAKARSVGSVRNITGDIAANKITGSVALGSWNLTGDVALGSWNLTGDVARSALTGDIDYQE